MINAIKTGHRTRKIGSFISGTWLKFMGVVDLYARLSDKRKQTLSAISYALGAGRIRSNWIYLKSLYSFIIFSKNYADRAFNSTNEIIEQAEKIYIEGEHHAAEALSSGRPLLITTIHMGDFQLGFLRLMTRFKPKRKTFLFKLNPGDQKEVALMKAFDQVKAEPTVLRVDESGGKAAYLALRQSHIVVLTIDLEVNVKSRSVIDFFGKPCHMQNGPATIAVLTKALVVPVVAFTNSKGQKIVRIEPMIDSDAKVHGATVEQRINQVTQQLANQMQQWLTDSPSQAHLWTYIADTMLCPLPCPMQCRSLEPVDARKAKYASTELN
jgi:lauroyl/myristoyl acyltransferase